MIVLVDVELTDGVTDGVTEAATARPEPGTGVHVELLDTSEVDGDAVRLASTTGSVQGTAGPWLTTVELVADPPDPRADLTVWVRVAGSGQTDTAPGDWITMQHVPVAPGPASQRVAAPVRLVQT